jgi:hypothetical protein
VGDQFDSALLLRRKRFEDAHDAVHVSRLDFVCAMKRDQRIHGGLVEAVLADMPTTGEGVNAVQHRVLRALIVREGKSPQEALDVVVDATMAMAQRERLADESGRSWTREHEIKCAVPRLNWVLRNLEKQHWTAVDSGHINADVPPDWLWPEAHEPWTMACNEGIRPQISRNANGWYVRRPPYSAAKEVPTGSIASEEHATRTTPVVSGSANDRDAVSKFRRLEFIKRFDIASIPPREWLYGRHYQRGVVSGTVASGGRGKSSAGHGGSSRDGDVPQPAWRAACGSTAGLVS